jgi:GNAT superfamily N-acetyltransferase
MRAQDRDAAYQIVLAFDEDDAEAFAETVEASVAGLFVMERDRAVVGFTGYDRVPDSHGSAWLSWTYVAPSARRQGVGAAMMSALRDEALKRGIGRLFISTSDYEEGGVPAYADAWVFYRSQGARHLLTVPDYYAPGEARLVFGLSLAPAAFAAPPPFPDGELSIVGFDSVAESKTSRCLMWDVVARDEGEDVLPLIMADARREGAATLFATLPDIQSRQAANKLRVSGFERIGRVEDFYGTGQHEDYWALDLR